MNRKMFFFALVLAFPAVSNSATSFNNLCWTVNGWPLRIAVALTGFADGDAAFTVSGTGTSTDAPVAGTAVDSGSGDISFSFQILAASESQNAVLHQLSLNRNTFNGTGSFRWFDSTNEGSSTATFVSCSSLSSLSSIAEFDEGDISQGFVD